MASEKSKRLELSDVGCPICLDILYEPISLPCKHLVCRNCLDRILQFANLQCPFCKVRISTWCRKAKKTEALIDKVLWQQIQEQFPDLVDKRREGQPEDGNCLFASEWSHEIVENGLIGKEFEEQIEAEKREMEERKKLEEQKSQELIRQLLKEEKEASAAVIKEKPTATPAKKAAASFQDLRNFLKPIAHCGEPSKNSARPSSPVPGTSNQTSTPSSSSFARAKSTPSATVTSSMISKSILKEKTNNILMSQSSPEMRNTGDDRFPCTPPVDASLISLDASAALESVGLLLTPELLEEQRRLEASINQEKEDEELARRLQMSEHESPQTRSMKRPKSEGPRQKTLEEMFQPSKRAKKDLFDNLKV